MAPDVPLVMPHPIEMPVAQDAALDRAADLILRAERPLVMLGAAASRPKLADALSQFVRRLRIPFFNTQMGKGAVAGGSNLYVGTAALSERDHVHQAIDRADLIIAIGHDTVEKPSEFKRRAAIEPVIGHLKKHHRMGRNYLAHASGDAINAVLAAARHS